MANHHFGEIGDVWKHLPLLAVAVAEQPEAYWESHAGSAAYVWSETEARCFGAARYLSLCETDATLGGARYTAFLRRAMTQGAPVYPGSPRLMLEALAGSGAGFVFCDLDGSSVASIEFEAERAGVAPSSLRCIVGDGNRALIERAGAMKGAGAGRVLAMLDPFSIEAVGEGGVSSLDALQALATAGVVVVLWWCAKAPAERESRRMLVERAIEGCEGAGAVTHTIVVEGDDDTAAIAGRFGVWSCSVTLVNTSERARLRCAQLGDALARVYSCDAAADDGAPGLRLETRIHAPRGAAL